MPHDLFRNMSKNFVDHTPAANRQRTSQRIANLRVWWIAQAMKDGRNQVARTNHTIHGMRGVSVTRAVHRATANPTSRQRQRIHMAPVVTPCVSVDARRVTKLTQPNHQCLIQ